MRFFKCSAAQSQILNVPEATNPKRPFLWIALITKHKPTARAQTFSHSLVCALHALRAGFVKTIPGNAQQSGINPIAIQDIRVTLQLMVPGTILNLLSNPLPLT